MDKILPLLTCVYLTCFVPCDAQLVDVIYNEDDLVGTCGNTCDSLPEVTSRSECRRISQCTTSQTGPDVWFYRCDWCKCKCDKTDDVPGEGLIEQSKKTFNEEQLWHTCRNTCNAWGLQRTDALGCSEIRNCVHSASGPLNGWYRCDYCECDCIVKMTPIEYRLINVNYDLDSAQVDLEGGRVVVGSLTVVNEGDFEEQTRRTISIQYTTSDTWSLSQSYSTTISAKATVKITAKKLDLGAELGVSETQTYSYTWGETKTWTVTDSITQVMVIPPHSIREAEIRGQRFEANVPYTATVVSVYEDGRETTEDVTGSLREASVGNFQLFYGDHTPIDVKRDSLVD